jgi:hypothetical protein
MSYYKKEKVVVRRNMTPLYEWTDESEHPNGKDEIVSNKINGDGICRSMMLLAITEKMKSATKVKSM